MARQGKARQGIAGGRSGAWRARLFSLLSLCFVPRVFLRSTLSLRPSVIASAIFPAPMIPIDTSLMSLLLLLLLALVVGRNRRAPRKSGWSEDVHMLQLCCTFQIGLK